MCDENQCKYCFSLCEILYFPTVNVVTFFWRKYSVGRTSQTMIFFGSRPIELVCGLYTDNTEAAVSASTWKFLTLGNWQKGFGLVKMQGFLFKTQRFKLVLSKQQRFWLRPISQILSFSVRISEKIGSVSWSVMFLARFFQSHTSNQFVISCCPFAF